MPKKERYFTVAILFAALVALGFFLPIYLDETPRDFQDPFYFTPRPTSTRFSAPVENVMDVLVAHSEPEAQEKTDTNCTYPSHYWQYQPDSWPAEIIISSMSYGKEEVRSLFSGENDTQTLLIRQVYAAFLNILHGANLNAIEETITDAVSWLDLNPPGKELSEFNRQQGRYLIQVLELYNNGEIGPGLCAGAPGTITPTPTITSTPTDLPPTDTATLPPVQTAVQQSTQPPPPPPATQNVPNPTNTAPVVPSPTQAQPTATRFTPTSPPLVTPTPFPSITPRVTPTPTPPATATQATPTLPAATPTPRPSASPTNPPAATPTPLPSSTPTNPPAATPTPPPAATPTPPPEATPTPLPSDTPTSPPPATNTPVPPTETQNTPPGQTRRPPTNTPKP